MQYIHYSLGLLPNPWNQAVCSHCPQRQADTRKSGDDAQPHYPDGELYRPTAPRIHASNQHMQHVAVRNRDSQD
jgi:hypothetical protein